MAVTYIDGVYAGYLGPHNLSEEYPSICYRMNPNDTKTMAWDGENTLDMVFMKFILQLTSIVTFTRLLSIALKRLHQPKVVADILGGLILGPSLLGKWEWFADSFFPYSNISTLETMANLGLLLFMFLVGVETDLTMLKQMGKKASVIALSGMIVPFIIGVAYVRVTATKDKFNISFILFFCVAISSTAFPVLARVLAELKLLNTELGRMAMSSALVNDVFAWILLAIAVVTAEDYRDSYAAWGIIINYATFLLFSFFVLRPLLSWLVQRTPEGETCKESDICFILIGVILCGFLTDSTGIPSLFGAFVYGLIIPIGPVGTAIVENLEDFVFGLLLPLFFASSGMHTDLFNLDPRGSWHSLLTIVILAGGAKVGFTLLIALYYQMPFQDGLALGLLMNTKGLIEIIVINIGRDQDVLDDQSFSTMVLVSVVTTCIVTPSLMLFYRPARQTLPYKKRTIQSLKPNSELRVLACLYAPRNVPTTINLLEAAQPSAKAPVYLYALHLMELTDRASSMLMVHNTRKSGAAAVNKTQAQSDYIFNTFRDYKQHGGVLSIEHLTAISPYSTMHEDIYATAEEKRASLIILPFHKQQTIDGEMETTHPAYRAINENIMAKAPCSVGILVDRNLGSLKRAADGQISQRVVLFFFGGPDDREALSYASRMAENPIISLTVIRFIPGHEASDSPILRYERDETGMMVQVLEEEEDEEKKADEDLINTFLTRNMDKMNVTYAEKTVNNGVETVDVIRNLDSAYDLYMVGRGQGDSELTTGLTDWSECPELGIIGDILASSDFVKSTSVLVLHKYTAAA